MLLLTVKPQITKREINGVTTWEVVCAGMTRRTVDEWQAKIYLHMAEEAYSADAGKNISEP